MTDQPAPGPPSLPTIAMTARPTPSGHPSMDVPTLFCDGIVNLAPSAQVARFYLFRTDPDTAGQQSSQNQVIAQIVMPLEAFVVTSVFFSRALQQMIASGLVAQEHVNELNAGLNAEQSRK
jgi:hypothetical protein